MSCDTSVGSDKPLIRASVVWVEDLRQPVEAKTPVCVCVCVCVCALHTCISLSVCVYTHTYIPVGLSHVTEESLRKSNVFLMCL